MLSFLSCFSSRFLEVWLSRSRRQPMGDTLMPVSRSASFCERCWKERTPCLKWRLTYFLNKNSASSDLVSDFLAVSMTIFLKLVRACCGFILLTIISLPCSQEFTSQCISAQVRCLCPAKGNTTGSLLCSSGKVWHLLLIFLRIRYY